MIRVYVETSAVNYFMDTLNGEGAEATRKLQVSKGREWYISTTVLWELLQIRDRRDLDACMYLSSFLFSENLLKSAAEITIDYIEKGRPDYLILDSPFTNSRFGDYWKRACQDKSFSFFIDGPFITEATLFVKELAKYMAYLTLDSARENGSVKEELGNFTLFLDSVYGRYFTENVDAKTRWLRTTAILVLFLQLCLCLDITTDAINKFWEPTAIKDPFDRLSYLLERYPGLAQYGPVWNIANAILIQCTKSGRSSRGAFHDGLHAIYLPFVDFFLTRDEHFRTMREKAKKEFEGLYGKIHHLDEVQLLRVDRNGNQT